MIMNRCILHVGTHKTGSSAIQATLNAMSLPQDIVLMADPGPNQSTTIRNAFSGIKEISRLRRSNTKASSGIKEASTTKCRDFLTENSKKTVIISAEGFDNISEIGLQELVNIIPHKTIEIVCYVRDPHGQMESALQQRIKAGMADLKWPSLIFSYKKAVSKYFRNDVKLDLVPYDRSTLLNGCVVQDFCARVGVSIEKDQVVAANIGLSKDAVSLLLHMNRFRQRRGENVQALRKAVPSMRVLLNELKGDKISIAPSLFHAASAERKEDIEWMEGKLGFKFKEARRHQLRGRHALRLRQCARLALGKAGKPDG